MRDTVFEPLPGGRCDSYVVGVVNAPVGAGKDLLCVVWINNDRVHRNIREIASLVGPSEGAAVGSASDLKHVARCSRRIGIKAAYRRVTYRQIRGRHGGIERDTQHGTQRNRVGSHIIAGTGDANPVGL